MHRIRLAVRENRLTSSAITAADYVPAIQETGRGWVALESGAVCGFAIGNRLDGNIWALFVEPGHEGCGHGRRLHKEMVEWLFQQGLPRLWLTTGSGTRAERFYRAAGWQFIGRLVSGEARYELTTLAGACR
jgi:GNAT superfamily N-acetyltransferase